MAGESKPPPNIGFFFQALVIYSFLYYGLEYLFYGEDYLKGLLSLDFSSTLAARQAVNTFSPDKIMGYIGYNIALVVSIFIAKVVFVALTALVVRRNLEIEGFKPTPVTAVKVVKLVLAEFWIVLMAITSWYNKKLFALFVIIVVFSIITLATIFLLLLLSVFILLFWMLLSLGYLVVITYNAIRLSVYTPLFLEREIGVLEAGRATWTLTHGKALIIFIAILIFILIYLVPSIIVMIFNMIVLYVMKLIITNIWVTLLIIIPLGGIFGAILNIISSSFLAILYSELIKEVRTSAGVSPAPTTQLPNVQQQPRSFSAPRPLPRRIVSKASNK